MKKIHSQRRLSTSLDSDVEKLLNTQVVMEAKANFFYLACASWCDMKGYLNAATFFYRQATEEYEHMTLFFKYINDVGGYALTPQIENFDIPFTNYRDVFQMALEKEIAVTKSINNIVEIALQKKDMISFEFLQWFVKEQKEEEETMRRIIEVIDIIGMEGQGIWLIEQEMLKFLNTAAKDTQETDQE